MADTPKITFDSVRSFFPHTDNMTYFNAASVGPFSSLVRGAITEHVDMRVAAEKDDSHIAFGTADELRKIFGKLIGARHREIGLGQNTTFGLNLAAYGLPLKPGDEVLLSDIEFPAAVYTFKAAAKARGLKIKYVKSTDRRFDVDAFEKAISKKSRVLVLSYVQFFNGYKNDLKTIGEICKKHRMFFVVDGIQGMGTEPLNVRSLGIDIFASGCQKWMLSPQGCGFFYVADELREKIIPPFMSWVGADWHLKFTDLFYYDKPYFDSARRFEMGYYAVLNIIGMRAAVRMFQDLGIANIRKHDHALIDRLAEYIRNHPYYRITCNMTAGHRSSIFTFTCKDLVDLHKELLRRRIILVRREGSIRVSVHLYNNDTDVDRLIQALEDFGRNH
ncbi:MAG: aminotransferase class V-fold PLP-dependent enzyme [candidate division Zixibacteria bacterium]|nr:aminotransferase class V-fold PLP-dependent enzyme [candidate division Zixibacteria bacterium]